MHAALVLRGAGADMLGSFAVVMAVAATAWGSTAERVYPGASWLRRSASEAGFDPEGLQAAMDYAAASPELTGASLVVEF